MKRLLLAGACALALAAPANAATMMSFQAFGHFAWWQSDPVTGEFTSGDYNGWVKATVILDAEDTAQPIKCDVQYSCSANAYEVQMQSYDWPAGPDEGLTLILGGDPSALPSIGQFDLVQGAFYSNPGDGGGPHFEATLDTVTISTFEVDGYGYGHTGFEQSAIIPMPEAGTWAMMIAGFALVGASLRRRRYSVAFA